jgi:hypothetical protein
VGTADLCQARNCFLLRYEVTCTDLHVNRMQAILLRQFRAWHELGPKDGSGSGPRSGLTAKPCRPGPYGKGSSNFFHTADSGVARKNLD